MRYILTALLLIISIQAQAAILVYNPTSGNYSPKSTLAAVLADSSTADKTIVVTSALSAVQSNISSATVHSWPANRALRVEKGGSINPTTKFTGLTYATPEMFGAKYDGSDDSPETLAAINSLDKGGKLSFTSGRTYSFASSVALPYGLSDTLIISGYGATIKMLTGADGALTMTRPTGIYDRVFQHITIEGLSIDANNVVGNYAVIGCADFLSYLSHDDIEVRDVKIYNLPAGSVADYAAGKSYAGINLSTQHAYDTLLTQEHYINNIRIKNVEVLGGHIGLAITAQQSVTMGGWPQEYNIWIDNILVEGFTHDTGVPRQDFFGALGIHVGGFAHGGRVTIRDCKVTGSSDVGIEVNSFDHARIENCVAIDCRSAFYHTYFNTPMTTNGSTVWENCTAMTLTDAVATTVARHFVTLARSVSDFSVGDVVYNNCKSIRLTAAIYSQNPGFYFIGDSADNDGVVHSITLNNPKVYVRNAVNATTLAMAHIECIVPHIGSFTVNNADIDIAVNNPSAVTMTQGALRFAPYGLTGSHGSGILTVNGLKFSAEAVGDAWATTVIVTMQIGSGATYQDVSGAITGLKYGTITNVTSGAGVSIYTGSSTYVSLVKGLLVYGCDFSNLVGNPYTATDATTGALVQIRNCIFNVRRNPTAVTVPSSTVAYTVAIGYDVLMSVVGGTVTKIEVSTNSGGTFNDIGVVAGLIPMRSGDQVKFTYSSVPTVTMLHQP